MSFLDTLIAIHMGIQGRIFAWKSMFYYQRYLKIVESEGKMDWRDVEVTTEQLTKDGYLVGLKMSSYCPTPIGDVPLASRELYFLPRWVNYKKEATQ